MAKARRARMARVRLSARGRKTGRIVGRNGDRMVVRTADGRLVYGRPVTGDHAKALARRHQDADSPQRGTKAGDKDHGKDTGPLETWRELEEQGIAAVNVLTTKLSDLAEELPELHARLERIDVPSEAEIQAISRTAEMLAEAFRELSTELDRSLDIAATFREATGSDRLWLSVGRLLDLSGSIAFSRMRALFNLIEDEGLASDWARVGLQLEAAMTRFQDESGLAIRGEPNHGEGSDRAS